MTSLFFFLTVFLSSLLPFNLNLEEEYKVPDLLAAWFSQAEIPEDLWHEFASVAYCESHDGHSFDIEAEGDGTEAKGIMQIHWEFWTKGSEDISWIAIRDEAGFDPDSDWSDPVLNTRLAYLIGNFDESRGNNRWRQWSVKPWWEDCQGWKIDFVYIEDSNPPPILTPLPIEDPESIPALLTTMPALATATASPTRTPTPTETSSPTATVEKIVVPTVPTEPTPFIDVSSILPVKEVETKIARWVLGVVVLFWVIVGVQVFLVLYLLRRRGQMQSMIAENARLRARLLDMEGE